MHRKALLIMVSCSLLLQLLPAAPGSGGEIRGTAVGRDYLQALFTREVTRDTPWPAEQLEVTDFSSEPAEISVPAGSLTHLVINQAHSDYLGRKSLTLALLVDGVECRRLTLRGDLRLFDEVAVAGRSMGRHTVIGDGDVEFRRRDITMMSQEPIRDLAEVVGKRLKVTVRTGETLFARDLEEEPLVKRGDLVTIMANSPGILVSVAGEVRNEGAAGEVVRVKNLMSRREILARVVDSSTVEVEY